MPKSLLLLAPLVSLAALVLMGARRAADPPEPPTPFVPQAVALDHALAGDAPTGEQLLDRAVAALARVHWLRVGLWQKMADRTTTFEATGTLTRGPHDCARLDLAVQTAAGPSALLVVSDGTACAQVTRIAGTAADVQSELLPTGADRTDFLRDKGCGGPGPVLAALRRGLRSMTVQTGLLRGRPVIQVAGELDPEQAAEAARTTPPARLGVVYLDAQTLWPHRLEWRGLDRAGTVRTVLQMEFREPVVDREPSQEECGRLFTYQPEEGP